MLAAAHEETLVRELRFVDRMAKWHHDTDDDAARVHPARAGVASATPGARADPLSQHVDSTTEAVRSGRQDQLERPIKKRFLDEAHRFGRQLQSRRTHRSVRQRGAWR